jgi:putative ABC transport system ATP-binding protein
MILALFHQLKSMGKTIVCVTHDDEFAESADRVINILDYA